MSTKVEKITVQNIKAISSAELDLKGCSAVVIAGNGKGKSTLISFLTQRLRGLKPDIILKQGTTEGKYVLQLTNGERFELPVNDTNKPGEALGEIKYFTKDEIKISVTKAIAERYFPATFDIDKFLSASDNEQIKILEGLAGIDLGDLNVRYAKEYENRTYANRKRDDAKVLLNPIDSNLPTIEADTTGLQTELALINSHNEKYETSKNGVEKLKKDITDNEKEIKRLQGLIRGLENENKTTVKRVKDGEAWLSNLENQVKDEAYQTELTVKINAVIESNKKVVENNKAIKAQADFKELETQATQADDKVKAIQKEKEALIRTATLPEGFEFSDSGIIYNGLPFTKEQQSLSGLYIATLKLAFMKLGVVKMIHFEASALDNESLSQVEQWAEKNDLQLLIEKVAYNGGEIEYQILEK